MTCECACDTCDPVEVIATRTNTLTYRPSLCINCGMCSIVCPHGVFAPDGRAAQLVRPEACMECGACQRNCPVGAIVVDSGVGCAAAMINAALTGRDEPTCGPDAGDCRC
jgi:NAD-dependent dihydropyrimidine dehydrogenase PreA subunit